MRVCWFGGHYIGNGVLAFNADGTPAGINIKDLLEKYSLDDSKIKDIALCAFKNKCFPENLNTYPGLVDWIFFRSDMHKAIEEYVNNTSVKITPFYAVEDIGKELYRFVLRELCIFPENASVVTPYAERAIRAYNLGDDYLCDYEEPEVYARDLEYEIWNNCKLTENDPGFYITAPVASKVLGLSKEDDLVPMGIRSYICPSGLPNSAVPDNTAPKWNAYMNNWSKLTDTCKMLLTAICVCRMYELKYGGYVNRWFYNNLGDHILNIDNEEIRVLSVLLIQSVLAKY